MIVATSINQSRHLLKWGLDPATADMTYYLFSDGRYQLVVENGEREVGECFLPAWSQNALLAVVPSEIHEEYEPYRFWYRKVRTIDGIVYSCGYKSDTAGVGNIKHFASYDPMTCLRRLLVWLLESGLYWKEE